MKLYLLTVPPTSSHHYYGACVVSAITANKAQCIHPDIDYIWSDAQNGWVEKSSLIKDDYATKIWAAHPSDVECRYLGTAANGMESGVILVDFVAFD